MAVYLYRLGRFAARRAWAVILTWILVLGVLGGAALALQKPFTKELSIPGTEFQQVLDDLDSSLPDAAGGTAGVVFSTRDGAPFTQEQKNAVARTAEAWSGIDGVEDASNPFATQKELDDGRADLAEGRTKLADGEQEIRDNQRTITDGKEDLETGRKKLESGAEELADGERQLAQGQAKISEGRAEITRNAEKLAKGRAELRQGQAQLDDGRRQLDAAREQLRTGQAELDANKPKIAEGKKQLAEGRAKVEAGEAQVAPAVEQLAEGEKQLAAARAELKDGQRQAAAGRERLEAGRAQLAQGEQQADALEAELGAEDPQVVALRAQLAEKSAELEAGAAELDATDAKLAQGEAELEAQAATLEAGKKELAEKTAPLEQARRTLEEKSAELAAGERELEQGQAKLDAGRATLREKTAELEKGQREIAAGRTQLNEGQAKLDAGRRELERGQEQIDANRVKLEAGKAELARGRIDIEAAARQLTEGQEKLDDAKATVAEKKTELRRGERRLALMDGLRSVNERGDVAMSSVRFDVPMNEVPVETKDALPPKATELAALGVQVDYSQQIAESLHIGGASEVVGFAVAAVILVVMLGSLLAAGLPLLIALVGLSAGMLAMLAMTQWVEMSDVTPALAVMLGLAVGIDYALFIVHRHRTILAVGDVDVRESIGRATGTAGSAVLFAGMTVVVALAALVLTGIPFLGVMGLAAAGTVTAAVLVALTLTPALLALIGPKVLSRRSRQALARQQELEESEAEASDAAEEHTAAGAERVAADHGHGWGGLVTRRPVFAILAAVALLATMAIPAMSLRLGLPDASQDAHDSTSYRAYTKVAEGFGDGQNAAILAVAKVDEDEARRLSDDQVTDLQLTVAEHLKNHENVEYVVPAAVSDDHRTLVYQIVPGSGPNDDATQTLIHGLRADRAQIVEGTAVDSVGFAGQTVANIDMSELLSNALPTYLAVVVGISILLLLLVFRSLLVPLLATGGFLLSVAASFGAVVAVYQWGWLGDLFGVSRPGVILSFLPTLVIGILFGLAMDYQMFLVSGMREAWAHGHTARTAVRTGFSHGARVVTAAALIMTAVFASFIYSPLVMIKPIGFALAAGVLLDAFVVRMTIMPAVMHLLGERAWYLPRWLNRILPDLDVEGSKLLRMREEEARRAATEVSVSGDPVAVGR